MLTACSQSNGATITHMQYKRRQTVGESNAPYISVPGYKKVTLTCVCSFPGLDPMSGITNAISSITKHDDKRCVARMLCELAAGGSPGGGYRGQGGLFDLTGLRGIAE